MQGFFVVLHCFSNMYSTFRNYSSKTNLFTQIVCKLELYDNGVEVSTTLQRPVPREKTRQLLLGVVASDMKSNVEIILAIYRHVSMQGLGLIKDRNINNHSRVNDP